MQPVIYTARTPKGQTKAHYLAPKPRIIDTPNKLSINYMKEANMLLYQIIGPLSTKGVYCLFIGEEKIKMTK